MDYRRLPPPQGHIPSRPAGYLEPGEPLEEARRYGLDNAPDLPEFYYVFRRHKWAFILAAFIGALAGCFIALFQTPIYQARIVLELQDLNDNFMNLKQVSPVSQGSGWNGQSDILTQIKILQSDTLTKRAVEKTNQNSAKGATYDE